MDPSTLNTDDLHGFKYLKTILPLLSRLHEHGCERGLQDATTLRKVQGMLGINKTALGSLSEAATVFDPILLTEIIGELGDQLRPMHHDTRLTDIRRTITLVDGTLLPALPTIVEALWIDDEHRAFKLHLHFELLKSVPVRGDLTAGQADERDVLEQVLEAERLYVRDRGYAKFTLLHKILQAQSSFVCRVRNHSVFDVLEERPLDAQTLQAGIVRDHVGHLGCATKQHELPACIRLMHVEVAPRLDPDLRGTEPYTLLLATDLNPSSTGCPVDFHLRDIIRARPFFCYPGSTDGPAGDRDRHLPSRRRLRHSWLVPTTSEPSALGGQCSRDAACSPWRRSGMMPSMMVAGSRLLAFLRVLCPSHRLAKI